ncbi:hypothetical protein OESDEN_13188 [Oesophagostomum dentatum]|uniref:Uncharacterized protein n=1 Tax=Oesophagostomum dentatum TaxID=61180 RepID=A0A0B1SV20_OESDE|nr:hypothetical protein OESDEN_13188 [Oesophagostomum dentatum]
MISFFHFFLFNGQRDKSVATCIQQRMAMAPPLRPRRNNRCTRIVARAKAILMTPPKIRMNPNNPKASCKREWQWIGRQCRRIARCCTVKL